jgi:hypothetical protein
MWYRLVTALSFLAGTPFILPLDPRYVEVKYLPSTLG